MNDKLLTQIKEKAITYFEGINGCHGWDHVKRVYDLSIVIGTKEGADLYIIKAAALLHDIGRKEDFDTKGKTDHAIIGAKYSRNILTELGAPEDFINSVVHCVATHRYRSNNPPISLEAQVLYDADKLDSIGAIGIGRAFMFASEVNAKLHIPNIKVEDSQGYSESDCAYREWLRKLQYIHKKMQTKTGIQVAQERHEYTKNFFRRLNMEYKGIE